MNNEIAAAINKPMLQEPAQEPARNFVARQTMQKRRTQYRYVRQFQVTAYRGYLVLCKHLTIALPEYSPLPCLSAPVSYNLGLLLWSLPCPSTPTVAAVAVTRQMSCRK